MISVKINELILYEARFVEWYFFSFKAIFGKRKQWRIIVIRSPTISIEYFLATVKNVCIPLSIAIVKIYSKTYDKTKNAGRKFMVNSCRDRKTIRGR